MLLLAFAAGCKENPVEEYGTGLVDKYQSTQKDADAASLSLLRQSIQLYRTANGRYPASLDELASATGTELDPEKYSYDPASGELTLTE